MITPGSEVCKVMDGGSASFNGRIHFRDAWRRVLGEVVQEESADVEERLWHVGAERLVLEIKTVEIRDGSLENK